MRTSTLTQSQSVSHERVLLGGGLITTAIKLQASMHNACNPALAFPERAVGRQGQAASPLNNACCLPPTACWLPVAVFGYVHQDANGQNKPQARLSAIRTQSTTTHDYCYYCTLLLLARSCLFPQMQSRWGAGATRWSHKSPTMFDVSSGPMPK